MYNFGGIKYDIQKTSNSSVGEVIIDLDSIKYLVEIKCRNEATSVKDYMSKLREVRKTVDELGREVYKENKGIYFGYYCGETTEENFDNLFGFGVYHRIYKSDEFKYFVAFNPSEMERELKINQILDDDKFGDE